MVGEKPVFHQRPFCSIERFSLSAVRRSLPLSCASVTARMVGNACSSLAFPRRRLLDRIPRV